MSFDIEQFWASLALAARPSTPRELSQVLMEGAHAAHLSPWTFWTLIGLVRQHDRQQWVAEVVKDRLGGDLQRLAAAGSLGHPSIPQQGLVPGETDWEYFFHGCGCCLTHRVSGEKIDVDFQDDSGDWIDRYFYFWFLESLKTPEAPEARLLELHASRETISLAIDELVSLGLLVRQRGFKVAPQVLEKLELIEAFCYRWLDASSRLLCAARVGDWLAAAALSVTHSPADAARLQGLADACRPQRLKRLEQQFSDAGDAHSKGIVFQALVEAPSPRVRELASTILGGSQFDGLMSTVLDYVCDRNDREWCDVVYRLFKRVNPRADPPQPAIAVRCARFLLEHDAYSRQVAPRLLRFRGGGLAEAATLALEFAPQLALRLFRRALRSRSVGQRLEAAAALAILDLPWCHAELSLPLSESADPFLTAECRAALHASRHPSVQQIATRWEGAHPYEREPGPWITIRDHMLLECPRMLQHEIEKLHDRVFPLRARQPPPESPAHRWNPFRWLKD